MYSPATDNLFFSNPIHKYVRKFAFPMCFYQMTDKTFSYC